MSTSSASWGAASKTTTMISTLSPSAKTTMKTTSETTTATESIREWALAKCVVNGVSYQDLETIPGSHPCDSCRCYSGKVECIWKTCNGAPENDCVPLYVPGTCCPVYTCTNSVTSLLPKNEDGNKEADRKQ